MGKTARIVATVRERESKDLEKKNALINVVEKVKRNINVKIKDSLLHSKTTINTCFVM